MKITKYSKALLKDAIKIAYKDIDSIQEKNLIELVDSLEISKQ